MSNFDTYQAEIAYRAERIRTGVSKRRRTRLPFVRRPAEATRDHR